jgi:hypothetical protein
MTKGGSKFFWWSFCPVLLSAVELSKRTGKKDKLFVGLNPPLSHPNSQKPLVPMKSGMAGLKQGFEGRFVLARIFLRFIQGQLGPAGGGIGVLGFF